MAELSPDERSQLEAETHINQTPKVSNWLQERKRESLERELAEQQSQQALLLGKEGRAKSFDPDEVQIQLCTSLRGRCSFTPWMN